MANCPGCTKEIGDTTTRVGLLCGDCQKARTSTASPASRGMMRALADRLQFTLPVTVEVVASHTREALDALIAGDFARFAIAQYALASSMDQISAIMHEADPTARAIQSLDPAYWQTVMATCFPKQVAAYRGRLTRLSDLQVVAKYLAHTFECKVRRDVCPEHASAIEELRARGLEVPQ